MFKELSKLALGFAILGMSVSQSAHAGAGIAFVGQMNMINQEFTPAPTTAPANKSQIGGGLLVQLPVGPVGNIEIGGIYTTRSYDFNGLNYKYPYIEMPLLLKLNLAHIITVGAGGYAAMGNGTVTGGSNSYEYGTGDLRRWDFGLEGELGLNLPIAAGAGFLVEGRYLMGLQNIDASPEAGSTTKWKGLELLAGIRLGF